MSLAGLRAFALSLAVACAVVACGGYRDTYTPAGIPNLHVFADGMYRTGVPPNAAAWAELRLLVERPGRKVTKVVLHDPKEGDESPAVAFGWNVVWVTLPPEEDQPLTIFVKPHKRDVQRAVQTILDAHARGDVVVWGCLHDRDRGGLVSMLVGMRLYGWTKDEAIRYAVSTGMRWETPGLAEYLAEDVSAPAPCEICDQGPYTGFHTCCPASP